VAPFDGSTTLVLGGAEEATSAGTALTAAAIARAPVITKTLNDRMAHFRLTPATAWRAQTPAK